MKNCTLRAVSKNATTANAVAVLISAVLLVFASTQPQGATLTIVLYALSLAVSCYNSAVDGIEELLNKRFSPNLIATVGVLCIFLSKRNINGYTYNYYQEAALVAIIYCFLLVALDTINAAITKRYMRLSGERLAYSVVSDEQTVLTDAARLKVGDSVQINDGDFLMFAGVTDGGVKVYTGDYKGEPVVVKITHLFDYVADFNKPADDRHSATVELMAARFSKHYTAVVFVLALLFALGYIFLADKGLLSVLYAVGSIILLSSSVVLTAGVFSGYILSVAAYKSRGVVLKGSDELDSLSRVSSVIINKNKVVTRGEYSVDEVYAADGYTEQQIITLCAAIQPDNGNNISAALCAAAGEQIKKIDSTLNESRGITASYNARSVICGSALLMRENGIDPAAYPNATLYLAIDDQLIGAVKLADKLKSDSVKAIKLLRAYKINTTIVSADNEAVTKKVSQLCEAGGYVALADSAAKQQVVENSKKRFHTAYVGDDEACLATAPLAVCSQPSESYSYLEQGDLYSFAKALINAKRVTGGITLKFYLSLVVCIVMLALSVFGIIHAWHITIVLAVVTAASTYLLPMLAADAESKGKKS